MQHVPLAPEAVKLLDQNERAARWVFDPRRKGGQPLARHVLKLGKIISRISKAATGKTATAHDLGRAFGSRWSKLVLPATLKELMRHESIVTTMTYYVQQSVKTTASELWAIRGTILGTIEPTEAKRRQKSSAQ